MLIERRKQAGSYTFYGGDGTRSVVNGKLICKWVVPPNLSRLGKNVKIALESCHFNLANADMIELKSPSIRSNDINYSSNDHYGNTSLCVVRNNYHFHYQKEDNGMWNFENGFGNNTFELHIHAKNNAYADLILGDSINFFIRFIIIDIEPEYRTDTQMASINDLTLGKIKDNILNK